MPAPKISWPRSLLEGIVYPVIVLTVGVVLAAGLSPYLVRAWDNNARVPDVFGKTEAVAESELRSAGFEILRFVAVCSSSVPQGQVREVLVDNSAPVEDETSLVNRYISAESVPTLDISKDTALVVKIGNGQPC